MRKDSHCTISYHVPGCDCADGPPWSVRTKPGKLYVIQKSATQKLFVTRQKRVRGNRGVGTLYWGQYIGKPGGKRYCACRFVGGPDLDAYIAKNPVWLAVEVQK